MSYLAEEDELGLISGHIPHHHYAEVEEVDPCTHVVAAYQKVGQTLEKKIDHKTMVCRLALVLSLLDTTTSHGISSDRKRREMDNIIILTHTLLRKMRWGKRWLVSTTTTIQMLRRWSLVPTWLQHTRRLGKSCRNL